MFKINDDLSIYVTRGDMVFLKVTAENNGEPYTFDAGEVLRIKVYRKKDCKEVVLQKDFPVTTATQEVELILEEADTKIGEVISKPVDYWYEVELNPFDNPQTIIGYDDDGTKVFKLFPEGDDIEDYEPPITPEDIPIVDTELDMTSNRPVENQVIARAFANLQGGFQAIHDAVAKLHVTPQMFGAIGDGKADDTEAIKKAIDYAVSKARGDGWKSVPKIYFPEGTYLVTEPLLDNFDKYKAHKFTFEGNSYTNTTIIVGSECAVLFPNHDIYGFTQFSNMAFEGVDNTQTFMEELSGYTHNAQSMYFHRCAFRKFHTVLKLGRVGSAATMTSETLFSECKISNCGTADNPCELFILDNQQSVNNRFYATDIESFIGILFKYKSGNSISYYQGSIICTGESTIVDGNDLEGNTSGGGNKPSLTMWGCRFELHGNTKLLSIGKNSARLVLSFNECGMGASNLNSGAVPISMAWSGVAEIYFTRCYNTRGLCCEFSNLNTSTTRSNVLSKIHFEDCDLILKDFIENSTISFYGANRYVAHPEIKIDGIYYNLDSVVRRAPLGDHLRVIERCLLDGVNHNGYGVGSTSKEMTYTVNVYSYIQDLSLINLGNGVYAGYTSNKVKCKLYNEEDTLLGEISGIPVSSGSGSLKLNTYVKTLKFVFSTDMATGPDLPILALAKIIG